MRPFYGPEFELPEFSAADKLFIPLCRVVANDLSVRVQGQVLLRYKTDMSPFVRESVDELSQFRMSQEGYKTTIGHMKIPKFILPVLISF